MRQKEEEVKPREYRSRNSSESISKGKYPANPNEDNKTSQP